MKWNKGLQRLDIRGTHGVRTYVVPEGISLLTTPIDDRGLLEANRERKGVVNDER